MATLLFASAGVVLEACSNESFSGVEPTPDASSPDGTTSDAAADVATADVVVVTPFDGGACNLEAPFGAPLPIAALDVPGVVAQTARLTHDELNIYFQQESQDAGITATPLDGSILPPQNFFQLVTASRSSIAENWSTPTPVSGVGNPAANETDPSVDTFNDILYFASDQAGTKGASDLWVATRGTPTTSFGAGMNVTTLNTTADESQPYLLPSGLALYYRSKASGNFDLAHATRTETSAFQPDFDSGIFGSINTPDVEQLATVTFDELTLYFATDRSDAGKGGREIWKATRSSTSVAFGTPTPVTELNTAGFAEPNWISDDGCRIYITSTHGGTAQLYLASKPPN